MNYRNILECRLCESNEFTTLINFSNIALGNNLQPCRKDALNSEEYPLKVLRCKQCGHFQLSCAVNPNLLYATNYTYLSGIGLSFVRHINKYVEWIEDKTNISKSSVIVDIGSNDGTCLEVFKNKGYTVCGVDPAELAVNISKQKGIYTINNFFNDESFNEIISEFGKVDLITSQNVLAHVDNLRSTFDNIFKLLNNNGFFVFEIGYFKSVLESGCFDTIYHEHLDYHHASPLVQYLSSIGFSIINIEVNEIQGGSLRLLLKKTNKRFISEQANNFLRQEKKSLIYDNDFLNNWQKSVYNVCYNINQIIAKEKSKELPCYAYGSPTKATLLLKMTSLTPEDIEFVVEDNEHKVGKFLPNNGISILPLNKLNFEKSALILILAWNFSDDIIIKLKKLYKVPIKVVVPLPKLKILKIC